MTEWIEHDGSGPPDLAPGRMIRMRFRDGDTIEASWDAFHASEPIDSNWIHANDPLDIVAYAITLAVSAPTTKTASP